MNIIEIIDYTTKNLKKTLYNSEVRNDCWLESMVVKNVVTHFKQSETGHGFLSENLINKDFHVPKFFLENSFKTNTISCIYATVYLLILVHLKESYNTLSPPKYKKILSRHLRNGDKPEELTSIYKTVLGCLRENQLKQELINQDAAFKTLEWHYVTNIHLNIEHLFSFHPRESDLDMVIPFEFFIRFFFMFNGRMPSFFYNEICHAPLYLDTYIELKHIMKNFNVS